MRRRGGNNSVDFSFFILLFNTKFMKKCKFYVFLYKNKNNNFDCTNSLYSAKSPHVPLEEEMGQLSKKKRAICWSIFLFVYVCYVQIGFGGGL